MEDIKKYLEEIKPEFIASLEKALAIPSVINEGEDGTPFGKAIDQVLDVTLQLCRDLGFDKVVKDEKGYYGYAELGSGEELVGILGHLDVVPPGNLDLWNNPPFEPIIKDNKLYARGAMDDKGPMYAALYAVKALLNAGVTFNKRVRFIFGTDEENLWRCMNRYIEIEEKPTIGFTPDSAFPLVYAEKGLLQFKLSGKGADIGLDIELGKALNAVPDLASYSGDKLDELEAALKARGFDYDVKDGEITTHGKSVHAKKTDQGINAIIRLVTGLSDIGYKSDVINFVVDEIGQDPYAKNIFGDLEDDMSGKLMFNIGKVQVNKDVQSVTVDVRFPVTSEKDAIVADIKKAAAKFNLDYEQVDFLKAIYVPKDSFLITTMMAVYQEVTGDTTSEPISSGGATYARAMDNFVAFGANYPGDATTEHQPNEVADLARMDTTMEIYAKTIYKLTR